MGVTPPTATPQGAFRLLFSVHNFRVGGLPPVMYRERAIARSFILRGEG
jgi:hypothetical protein